MAVQTKEQVLSLLQEHHHPIRTFGVRRLGLFGSFVREQQRRESDVDMLVEFEPGAKTFDAFMQLAFFLRSTVRTTGGIGDTRVPQSAHWSAYSARDDLCQLR